MNRCRTCQFFEINKDSDPDDIPRGYCHLRPPPMLPQDGIPYPAWPEVSVDDWCGEQRQLAFPSDAK
jgi:hypothetical protein